MFLLRGRKKHTQKREHLNLSVKLSYDMRRHIPPGRNSNSKSRSSGRSSTTVVSTSPRSQAPFSKRNDAHPSYISTFLQVLLCEMLQNGVTLYIQGKLMIPQTGDAAVNGPNLKLYQV